MKSLSTRAKYNKNTKELATWLNVILLNFSIDLSFAYQGKVGIYLYFLLSSQGRRFRSRHELRQYFEENGETFKSEMFDFCLSGKRRSRYSDGSIPGARRWVLN